MTSAIEAAWGLSVLCAMIAAVAVGLTVGLRLGNAFGGRGGIGLAGALLPFLMAAVPIGLVGGGMGLFFAKKLRQRGKLWATRATFWVVLAGGLFGMLLGATAS